MRLQSGGRGCGAVREVAGGPGAPCALVAVTYASTAAALRVAHDQDCCQARANLTAHAPTALTTASHACPAAAIVSIVIESLEHPSKGWIDGVAIMMAVIIVATVTATNDYNKQLQFRKLSKESESMVEVRQHRAACSRTCACVRVCLIACLAVCLCLCVGM